jgi:magnesium transporter
MALLRSAMREDTFESLADIAVCRDGLLLGLIPVETALGAADDVRARSVMDPDPPVVFPGENQEKAAWKAVNHGESSLAVADAAGRFVGLVPPARLLRVLLAEHDDDLARLGGFLRSAAGARRATAERLSLRLWYRIPWLLLGLLGSAGAAVLVRGYEEELAADVRLAFFIPGIVYMADAVGTQTETVLIRGFSVGVPLRRVFRLEVLTGLLVGMLLAAITVPAIWLTQGSLQLGLAVGLALLGACAVATAVAMALPWLLNRTGRDPAFGSGPLSTVVQDLLSLLIYFAVAVALIG